MRIAGLALAAWAGLAGTAGAFTLDVGDEAIERALGVQRVRSLAVGDRAAVSSYDFCRGEDGSLQLRTRAELSRPNDYVATVEAVVRPGRSVAVTIKEAPRGDGRADVRRAVEIMLTRGPVHDDRRVPRGRAGRPDGDDDKRTRAAVAAARRRAVRAGAG
jgi:hypothetical protein